MTSAAAPNQRTLTPQSLRLLQAWAEGMSTAEALAESSPSAAETQEQEAAALSELETRTREQAVALWLRSEEQSSACAQEHRMLERILQATPDLIYIFDLETKSNAFSNRNVGEMLGYTAEEVLAMGPNLFPTVIHPDDLTRVFEAAAAAQHLPEGQYLETTYRVIRKGGEVGWLYSRDIPFERHPDGRVKRMLGVAQDVTALQNQEERNQKLLVASHRARAEVMMQRDELLAAYTKLEQANAELARLSVTDGLTGLFNHRAFQQSLADMCQEASEGGPGFSVVLLDLDRFKQINDVHGHLVGDEVLKLVADTIRTEVSQADVAARYGGEEFAVIAAEADLTEAWELAESLRLKVEALDTPAGPITVSLGVAWVESGESVAAKDLLMQADSALYDAKRSGRNRTSLGASSGHRVAA